jgi:O-antigen/teichoic acid export membrane protein
MITGLIKKLRGLTSNSNFKSLKWQFYSQGLGFFYLIFSTSVRAKSVTLQDFANISISIAFITSIQAIFNFQTWRGIIKFGSESLASSDFTSYLNVLWNGIFIDFVTGLLSFLLILLSVDFVLEYFSWSNSIKSYIYYLSIIAFCNSSQGTIMGYFRLEGLFVFISKRQIFLYILFSIINLYFFFKKPTATFFILLYVFQILLIDLINILYFIKSINNNNNLKYQKNKFKLNKLFLKFNFWVYLKSLFDLPYRSFDIIIASKLLTINETGVYSALKRILNSFNQIFEPINIIVFPKLAKHVSENEIDKGFLFLKYLNKYFTVIFIILGIIFAFFSREILGIVFSENFEIGYIALIILIFSKFPFYGLQLYYSYFIALGFVKEASYISLISNFIFVILSIFLSIEFGLNGFIVAVSFFSILTTLSIFPILKNKYKFSIY